MVVASDLSFVLYKKNPVVKKKIIGIIVPNENELNSIIEPITARPLIYIFL